ncbi:MAG: sorbosone dehydrogenase family protein, partial [Proteobacteria bacterium]
TQKLAAVVGWNKGEMPKVPAGFTIEAFADKLDNPRWIYVLPNGDVLVAESNTTGKVSKAEKKVKNPSKAQRAGTSANRITLLRDSNKDGKVDVREVFLSGLNQPLGMLLLKDSFYVANTDSVMRYPYKDGETKISAKGVKILDLPAGGYNNHWTRNLLASADSSKIYVSVGSGSNVAEHGMDNEKRRANILEINPDGSGERIFASGLRNPVGMDLEPTGKALWTAVNERDELGDELVPDYITSVKDSAFYGWPYSYYGAHEDPRLKGQNPELVKKALVPDLAMGPHTASLGLAFNKGEGFPEKYKNAVFVGQHGSWNRSKFSGYRVAFVPFKNGKPAGEAEDFVTGFIKDEAKSEVYGRPVGVTFDQGGNLLVADDSGDTVWIVRAKK